MRIKKVDSFTDINLDEAIILISGILSQRIIAAVIEDIEDEIGSLYIDNKIKNNIIYNSIELLQNILNYSNYKFIGEDKKQISKGRFVFGFSEEKNKYYVFASNEIVDSDEKILTNKFDFMNSLDDKSLKKYMKDVRKTGIHKHEYGAGIGLISMALKNAGYINYNFKEKEGIKNFSIVTYI